MDALGWLVAIGAAAVAFAVGGAVGSRRAASRVAAAEEALGRTERELRDRMRSSEEERHVRDVVLASMEDGVLLVDRNGAIIFTNDALKRHLGAEPRALDSLLPLELRTTVRHAGSTGSVERCEVEVGSPGRWLRGTAIPVSDGGSILLVVWDVTEARRIDAVRRDFVANASHELKTPAASIQAAAETLGRAAAEDPPAVLRFTAQLEREAVRLSRIVADLLDLSRLESGSDLTETVRIDAIVREEAQRSGDPAREAGIDLVVHADHARAVHGSARDLSLLVRNLLDNAIRYSRDGGAVEISVREVDGSVALRVQDAGIGIPSRELPRIFERFYRVDRARSRETGGTGLGLAIVKHVAENHGGTVTVESELGRGTTFEVRLPASPN